MNINKEYKIITGNRRMVYKYPRNYTPAPIQNDYARGYIIRYFIKLKSNKDSSIIEVEEKEFKMFTSVVASSLSDLYLSTSLRWKISGERSDVELSNDRVVKSLEPIFPGLNLKLGNRLEFWK